MSESRGDVMVSDLFSFIANDLKDAATMIEHCRIKVDALSRTADEIALRLTAKEKELFDKEVSSGSEDQAGQS